MNKIFSRINEVKIDKTWIYQCPSEEKKKCWNSYFHIAIENSKNKNYFTEKIIDCFLTKTIPIYWGCSNIEEYFNKDGFIKFNSDEELMHILNNLTPCYYHDRKKVIEENYKKALYYADFFYRLNEILEQIVTTNNI